MEEKFNDNLEINGDEQDAYKKWMESFTDMLDMILDVTKEDEAKDGPIKEGEESQ